MTRTVRQVDLAASQHLLRDEIPGNGLCMVTQMKIVAANSGSVLFKVPT